ncbi:F0F1 ATP synthase subunit gamma [Lactiplantibacillus pentosus]|uniref:F0F1 ATP synthase subunit gamma n=1 Tax=Lactiplantibacillus pentosus TaxID=1589 RepID=UPI001C1FD1D9|nr:F0F1 ATP synthase subunit gamma [Lactiplantibacillus pentosus]MBU7501225.1 F0F1 ATP synthase subunit gamma [Lactiplantibacillus pentosus]MBU7507676.1 F0F1 ATP synthase subunit gamma [Lactiplantibacillus pentosus]
MAESLMDVKRRIDSTKKTHQITSAMQMVSTSKLNQIQKHTTTYQVYASKVESIVSHLAKAHLMLASVGVANSNSNTISVSELLAQRPVKKTGLLIITSDRGLVGSYNSNVLKQTNDFMRTHKLDANNAVVLAVGGTGADFYKKNGLNVAYEYRGVSDVPTFKEVREIVKTVTSMYHNEVFDELYVFYNHFINRLSSGFRSVKMLPISEETFEQSESDNRKAKDSRVDVGPEYEMEPSEEAILSAVLPQYAESLVYGAILDAKTAEHASSSTAMKAASDNAGDLIDKLNLKYNRARQAAITTEITEITGGLVAQE